MPVAAAFNIPKYFNLRDLLHLQYSEMQCVVGIVTSLRAGQFGVRILAGREDFSFLQNVKTGSKPQTEVYSVGTGVLSCG
jgi:hypothetical protein